MRPESCSPERMAETAARVRSTAEVFDDHLRLRAAGGEGGRMQLELDEEERRALRGALQTYVSDLREEIVKTEKKDWRVEMHAEEERLKGILEKLR